VKYFGPVVWTNELEATPGKILPVRAAGFFAWGLEQKPAKTCKIAQTLQNQEAVGHC
jgi:hypothetical protein